MGVDFDGFSLDLYFYVRPLSSHSKLRRGESNAEVAIGPPLLKQVFLPTERCHVVFRRSILVESVTVKHLPPQLPDGFIGELIVFEHGLRILEHFKFGSVIHKGGIRHPDLMLVYDAT